ncbi:hypothetical protein [Streptomyces sp. NPDC018045]|uniref:DUF7848 domain-containing protein n=1 Tax=Streptomyces sp. NPDC018045 TaxID=3365037 RepID=UPI0037AB88FB
MTSPSRDHLTRLMHARGHDGVLYLRTGDGSDAAPAPLRESERLTVQITGTKEVTAECVTPVDGNPCGAKSSTWMSIVPPQDWARGHSVETGHTVFTRHEIARFQVLRPPGENV